MSLRLPGVTDVTMSLKAFRAIVPLAVVYTDIGDTAFSLRDEIFPKYLRVVKQDFLSVVLAILEVVSMN